MKARNWVGFGLVLVAVSFAIAAHWGPTALLLSLSLEAQVGLMVGATFALGLGTGLLLD